MRLTKRLITLVLALGFLLFCGLSLFLGWGAARGPIDRCCAGSDPFACVPVLSVPVLTATSSVSSRCAEIKIASPGIPGRDRSPFLSQNVDARAVRDTHRTSGRRVRR